MKPLQTEFRKYTLSIAEQSWKLNDRNVLSYLRPATHDTVLDVGCGNGDQTINWNEKIGSQDLIGVEISREAAKEARKRGVQVVICDLNRPLPFVDMAFDVIVSNQVIEHLVNVDLSLSEINRVLKKSGYAVISTENLSSWHNIFAVVFGLRPFSVHYSSLRNVGNPFSPHGSELMSAFTHEDSPHIKVFTYFALTAILQLHNFSVDSVKGAGNYIVPLGPMIRILSRLDPIHSHLLTCRLRKRDSFDTYGTDLLKTKHPSSPE
jgi:ubiquinone/menaquinone biosynthesis C-methylase UbiE